MKISYDVKLTTHDGTVHKFKWFCTKRAMMEIEDVAEKFLDYSSYIVKETDTSTRVVPRSAVSHFELTQSKDQGMEY